MKTCSVVKMAASFAVTLSQDDIPGASLEGRHPAELNNDALRFWLKCRGDKCKGLKTGSTVKTVSLIKCLFVRGPNSGTSSVEQVT